MGSEIGTAIRLAGPAGIGVARRLVEIDGQPYLLLEGLLRPVRAGEPFRRAPVATGVASKLLGIESCAHGTRHDTANQRGHPEHSALRDFVEAQAPAATVISRIEVLGYHKLNEADRQIVERFI